MYMNIFSEIDQLQIKIEKIRPLSEDQNLELRRYFNIGLAYSSNAIEGNTLTESETKAVIEDGLTIGGKPLKHHLEATGHHDAFNFMYSLIKKNGIIEEDIKNLHHLLYRQIEPEKAGVYRKIKVFISGSSYSLPDPKELKTLMKKFEDKYKIYDKNIHPVRLAALAHNDFVFIHPFLDGNGRIARLITNLILIHSGYPVTIIPPVLRMEYIALLEKAHENDEDYINFMAERVKQSQLEYIRMMG
ncbi:MAG TPA: cell filamentation protein Fic [Bacteroidales bacterium]|nr:cell filamentation protein Fic [Bacteroidales bacterium]